MAGFKTIFWNAYEAQTFHLRWQLRSDNDSALASLRTNEKHRLTQFKYCHHVLESLARKRTRTYELREWCSPVRRTKIMSRDRSQHEISDAHVVQGQMGRRPRGFAGSSVIYSRLIESR
jgi:hypothetical protein